MTLVTPNRTMLIDALRGDTDRTVPLVQAMIETAIKSGHGRVFFFAHYATREVRGRLRKTKGFLDATSYAADVKCSRRLDQMRSSR